MSSDDHSVGYGRPPAHTRFKPGQSGNPKGRPKGSRNFTTELLEELGELTKIRENAREYNVTKQRAIIKALVGKALTGDPRATTCIVTLCARLIGPNGIEEQRASASDQRVIEAFITRELARRKQAKKVNHGHAHQEFRGRRL